MRRYQIISVAIAALFATGCGSAAGPVQGAGKQQPDRFLDGGALRRVTQWVDSSPGGAREVARAPWGNVTVLIIDVTAGRIAVRPAGACSPPEAGAAGTGCRSDEPAVILEATGRAPLRLQAPELARWLADAPDSVPQARRRPMGRVFNSKANVDRVLDSEFAAGRHELERLRTVLQSVHWVDDPELRNCPRPMPGGSPEVRLTAGDGGTTLVRRAYRCPDQNDFTRCTAELISGRPTRSPDLVRDLETGKP